MFAKEWSVKYKGHSIVVRNSWSPKFLGSSTEAKLYIDGSKVDSSNDKIVFASNPALRGAIKGTDGSSEEVEVFAQTGLFKVKLRICVAGTQVLNDGF